MHADNPYFEEVIDGITSNVWGYDGSSSNVREWEGEDGVSRCGVESNDVEVVLDGVRGLRSIVFMLFAIVVILLVVIVLKWRQLCFASACTMTILMKLKLLLGEIKFLFY